jgi:hypothetical protein
MQAADRRYPPSKLERWASFISVELLGVGRGLIFAWPVCCNG